MHWPVMRLHAVAVGTPTPSATLGVAWEQLNSGSLEKLEKFRFTTYLAIQACFILPMIGRKVLRDPYF